MNFNFENMKKKFKNMAKRNKIIAYSEALFLTFLLSGNLIVADETNIDKTVKDIEAKLKEERKINKRKLNISSVELSQLEEQGEQVIKTPWSSWQFSGKYVYTDMGDMIKGTKDKDILYDTSGRLMRPLNADGENMWWISKVVPISSVATNSVYKQEMQKYSSSSTSSITNLAAEKSYGITSGKVVYDQPAQIAISVSIEAKEIKGPEISDLSPQEPNIPRIPDVNIIEPIDVPAYHFDIPTIILPQAPVPPTGLGSSGVLLDPKIMGIGTPLYPVNPGIISVDLNTDLANDGYYVLQADGEHIEFAGNINVTGSKGAMLSTRGTAGLVWADVTTLTNISVTNNGNINVTKAALGIQHETVNSGLIFNNNGNININYDSTVPAQLLFIDGSVEVRNNASGIIHFENSHAADPDDNEMREFLSTWNANEDDPNPMRLVNDGIITVKGAQPVAYSNTVLAHHYGHLTSTVAGQHTVINNGTIDVDNAIAYLQDYSTGVYDASGGGILNLKNRAVGIELYLVETHENIFNSSTLRVGTINVDGISNGLGEFTKAINIETGDFPTITIAISDGNINLGTNSMGIIANAPDSEKIINSTDINITGGNSYGFTTYYSTSIYVTEVPGGNALFENNGNITLNVANIADASAGIFHNIEKKFLNKGNIDVKGQGIQSTGGLIGIAIGAGSNFENNGMGGKYIKSSGARTTGVYLDNNNLSTIKNTTLIAENSSIGVFSDNGSNVNLENITGYSTNGGILFYSSLAGTSKINFTTLSTINIGDKGIGFYYDLNGGVVANYYTGLSNVNLNMSPGSSIFLMDNVGARSINTLPSMAFIPWASVTGSDYKDAILSKGDITIDHVGGVTNFDLNNLNNSLNRNAFYMSKVNLAAGSTITGSNPNQKAIVQESYVGAVSNADINAINHGTIDLQGDNSVGLYVNYGTTHNNSTLKTTGNKSVAMYGTNSSDIQNVGNITIGSEGVGIYGISYINPSNVDAFGTGLIQILNSGTITAQNGNKTIGIYAKNNKIGGTVFDSTINLSNGTVNVQNSENGVGVYSELGIITDTGSVITVGKNGLALYAKDSNVTLNNTTINLHGDNAMGFYLDGTTSFNGTGTINISGQNVTLFSMLSSGTVTNNFVVGAVDPGSTYSIGRIKDTAFNYNGSAFLGANGTLISGTNSAVKLDTGSSILAVNNDSIIGVMLDGQFGGVLPAGFTPGIDVENKGTIDLNNNSVGLYGTNSVRALNNGIINVKNNSAGIYVTGVNSLVDNRSTISFGENSQGIYIKDGQTVNNSGLILSNLNNTVGMYAKGITGNITNTSNILMNGNIAKGIYSSGGLSKLITNTGNIQIGDTADITNRNIAMYTDVAGDTVRQDGTITVGNDGIGIYGSSVILDLNSTTNIGQNGVGILSTGGNVTIDTNATISVGNGSTIVYGKNAVQITDGTHTSIGDNSFGFILTEAGLARYTNTAGNVTMGNNSVYVYSNTNSSSEIMNNANITIQGNNSTVIYGNVTEDIENNGALDISAGVNNIGIYSSGGFITNNGPAAVITVGKGAGVNNYGIGLAAEKGTDIFNDAPIHLTGDKSIGIYANASYVHNRGDIHLSPTGDVSQMIGIYADNYSTVYNYGNITTTGDYRGDTGKLGIYAMVIKGRSVLENYGNITINADNSTGIYLDKATIKNYGNITVDGNEAYGVTYVMSSETKGINGEIIKGQEENNINGTSGGQTGSTNTYGPIDPSETGKKMEDVDIEFKKNDNGEIASFVDGIEQLNTPVTYEGMAGDNVWTSGIGIYIDTLGNTNPISDTTGSIFNPSNDNAIIIGAEAATKTSAKTILVNGSITDKFMKDYSNANYKGGVYSGSLTWTATLVYDGSKYSKVLMQKIDYTNFAGNQDVYNFANGLDILYGMATEGTRDKEVFNKLNDIGANEEKLLFQAYDEMMGQPYANVQQRILSSGNIIDKGIDDLFRWNTLSKQSNKIQAIGGRSSYKTNTAGVVDYKQTSGGIVYLNEHETVKLGDSLGWYAGLLQSRFDFKDMGESKEDATVGKVGTYKSTAFDYNNSLNWTIKGDISGGYHRMDRKFLVVDEIYNAKGNYYSYGVNVTNEISKDFRISKNIKVGALASLELGYGRYTGIKEDKGEIKLEVKGNDYYSIKPAVGGRISFDRNIGEVLTFRTELIAMIEQELGETTNVRNQAKVANTTADYFNLRKDKREKTNGKIGLNLELGTSRFGFNISGEYNTEGENSQIGAGIKISF